MTKSKSLDRNPKHRALYHALMESILEDEDAMDKGVADKLKKRKPDDADRDEDPPARSEQGLKRRKTSKDVEPSKKVKSTDTSKGTTKSQPKLLASLLKQRRQCLKLEILPQNLGEDMGKTDKPPNVKADPKDWFKKPKRPLTPDPEWNTDKKVDDGPTQNWLSDLAKAEKPSKTFNELMSTPIDFTAFAMHRLQISDLTKADLVGPVYNLLKADYFFNNDLAHLQGESTDKTYTTSLTKTKAAKYDLQGIKDMVPMLWSPIKVVYDKHVVLVTNVKVNKWYGYGHLELIEVRRADQQLYKFMESDFPRLHLNDIEDMLLLVVQTDSSTSMKRVEDLQLGVESYQKKLNISRPLTHKAGISDLAPYTAYSNPQGFIYLDKLERNKLMCTHEFYKFSDDTLHDMATNLRMGYNKAMPRRRLSNLDKTQSHIMVKDIDR
ncbi:hypothetical protein Tco_1533737 [Tanacetum coccineum]